MSNNRNEERNRSSVKTSANRQVSANRTAAAGRPNGKKRMSKKQRRKRKRIILGVEIVVVLLLLCVLAIWLKLSKINQTGKLDEDQLSINDLDEETRELLEGYTNIALFGLDNRSNGSYGSGNSDSIMIASINNDTHEVRLVSVYRDTYLNVYDDDFKKCNSAYAKKGVDGAIAMLNQNLDLNIKDYVAVDFNAMVEVIDLLGGIDIEVTTEEAGYMQVYIDEIQKVTGVKSSYVTGGGVCTLDGVQATAYCRVRYTAGDDFKRAERQRIVLSAMADKAKKAKLTTLNKIIDAVFEDIDTSLTSSEIVGLAAYVSQYEIADTSGFPFSQTTMQLGKKGDVVVPTTLESNVKLLHAYLFGDEEYEPSDTVAELSEQIISDTGKTEEDGNTYSADYVPTEEDTEEESEKE
ncbi:MAG: LCP family protein [Roseburia sp.]